MKVRSSFLTVVAILTLLPCSYDLGAAQQRRKINRRYPSAEIQLGHPAGLSSLPRLRRGLRHHLYVWRAADRSEMPGAIQR